MSLGFAQPYDNPHLAEAVQLAARESGLGLDKLVFSEPPSFRSLNNWRSLEPLLRELPFPINLLHGLKWVLRNDKYVFLGSGKPAPGMPLLFVMACLTGRPVYLVSEGLKSPRPSLGLRLMMATASLVGNGCLLAIGNTAARDFRSAGLSWPARRFGFSEKPPSPSATIDAREGAHSIRLLVVGQLIPRKRVDWLIRQLAAHPMAGEFILEVCGDGPDRASLERLASTSGVRVEFHGFLAGAELAAAYSRADIFIHPAQYEGWGVVLNHATFFGLPIIAFKGVRSAEGLLVRVGINGYVFEKNAEFSDQLSKLTVDTSLRNKFAAASKLIGERWTPAALGEGLARVMNNPEQDLPCGEPLAFCDI